MWYEKDDGAASTAYADEYEIKDGILIFKAEKPIVLSAAMKFIVK